MRYVTQDMELEEVSALLHGSVNDVVVCKDLCCAAQPLYVLWVIHDRACAKEVLMMMQAGRRGARAPYVFSFTQNELLCFGFPYREARPFRKFAKGQLTSPETAEEICVNLVTACMMSDLPWPVLALVFEQGLVHINKDNGVYFGAAVDLSGLQKQSGERECVSGCVALMLELLTETRTGGRRPLKSLELLEKKNSRDAYHHFHELYQDVRVTAAAKEKVSLRARLLSFWETYRDALFRALLVLCLVLLILAGLMALSQAIFGEIPFLRLFRHTFDIIGTENLHQLSS